MRANDRSMTAIFLAGETRSPRAKANTSRQSGWRSLPDLFRLGDFGLARGGVAPTRKYRGIRHGRGWLIPVACFCRRFSSLRSQLLARRDRVVIFRPATAAVGRESRGGMIIHPAQPLVR